MCLGLGWVICFTSLPLSSHLALVCSAPLIFLGPSVCCQVLEVHSHCGISGVGGGRGNQWRPLSLGSARLGCLICCSLLSIVNKMLCRHTHILEIGCTSAFLHAYSTMSELTLDTANAWPLSSHCVLSPQPFQILCLAEFCKRHATCYRNCWAPGVSVLICF